MIMARPKKCPICGKSILTSDKSVPYKGRFVHESCFNIGIQAITMNKQEALSEATKDKRSNKKTKEIVPKVETLKEAVSEEEYEDKKNYYLYLKQLIGEEISGKDYALTKKYMNLYNLTYKQMRDTLIYLNEILEKDLSNGGIGLIPYYYTEALRYYDDLERIKSNNQDINIDGMYQEKIVYINHKRKRNKLLDVESI